MLPLGADDLVLEPKTFHAMSLLYVGTLRHRNIDTTIEGFDRFCDTVRGQIVITYDLVGGGSEEDERSLQEAIRSSPHRDAITYHGPKPRAELLPFFQKCNVGIAYIPRVRHFDVQPPTKVFEYLLAGMAVAATSTQENLKLITPDNGVVFEDSAAGMARGLTDLYHRRGTLDSARIRESASWATWPRIVEHHLRPMLRTVRTRLQR